MASNGPWIARLVVVALALLASLTFLAPRPGSAISESTVTRFDDPEPDGCRADDCSLREAIIAANAGASLDRISLPSGTFVLTLEGAGEDQGLTGDLDVTEGVALQGSGQTIIDAAGADRIFDLASPAERPILLELNRMALVHGRATASDGDPGDGGAVRARGVLQLNGVDIRYSTADGSGGAVYFAGETFGFHGGTVADNHAAALGGAFYATGRQAFVSLSSLLGNSADEGGGIWTAATQLLSIENVISQNTSEHAGGGVFMGPDVIATVAFHTVTGNSAGTDGGGLFGGDEVQVSDTAVSDNQASRDGGGIYFDGSAISVLSSTLSGNTAARGGAVLTLGDLTAENSTVSGNHAAGTVGGIFVDRGSASLHSLTIASNSAGTPLGAALANDGGVVTVGNTIVAGSPGAANCGGEIESTGHNLEDADTCGFDAAGDVTNADPMLGPLQDNGGRTWTHALLTGSPAIDAAGVCQGVDQRERQRPSDGNADGRYECDIGSFEFGTCYHSAGDVNGDLRVNSIDAALLLQRAAGLIASTPCYADVNSDGEVDSLDAQVVLQVVAGYLSALHPPPK